MNDVAYAEKPIVEISGGDKIGETITVRCKTYHTCPYDHPSLSLNGIEKSFRTEDRLEDNYHGGGWYVIRLTRTGVVQSERHEIQCSVRHRGGLSASTVLQHNAKCKCYFTFYFIVYLPFLFLCNLDNAFIGLDVL